MKIERVVTWTRTSQISQNVSTCKSIYIVYDASVDEKDLAVRVDNLTDTGACEAGLDRGKQPRSLSICNRIAFYIQSSSLGLLKVGGPKLILEVVDGQVVAVNGVQLKFITRKLDISFPSIPTIEDLFTRSQEAVRIGAFDVQKTPTTTRRVFHPISVSTMMIKSLAMNGARRRRWWISLCPRRRPYSRRHWLQPLLKAGCCVCIFDGDFDHNAFRFIFLIRYTFIIGLEIASLAVSLPMLQSFGVKESILSAIVCD
jgi:hypothetical protein